MITIGVDIGSIATKGVIICGEHKWNTVAPTGWSPREAGQAVIEKLLDLSRVERPQVERIIATGYGRVTFEEADKTVTEIKCHARGVAELHPEVRTIIDIGGQDSKVISIAAGGRVLDFTMNDKCAAGTGRFLQVMATALGLDVRDLGMAEDPDGAMDITSMCTVFAESEIIGLMVRGNPKAKIIAGLHNSVGKRIAPMVRRMGLKAEVAFTGGVAINPGVRRALEKELGCRLIVADSCQFTGALGAALLARHI